jgi:hypothetical protein
MRNVLQAVWGALASPWGVCLVSLLIGSGMLVAGVFVLFGLGWALLTASAPAFFVGAVTLRGLARG